MIGDCRMTQHYVSATDADGFHLSIYTALAILGQLAIIHGHAINDTWRKDHEVLLSKLSTELIRPIRTPDKISTRLRIIDQHRKPSHSQKGLIRVAYTWSYDMGEGAFTGDLRCHFSFYDN
jgi:hypothetical protein